MKPPAATTPLSKRALYTFLIALLGALAFAAAFLSKTATGNSAPPPPPAPVHIDSAPIAAAPAPGPPPPSFASVLLPPKMANVSSRADGRLVEVAVTVGQIVHKGDRLAVFDARERQHDLAMTEAQLKSALGAAGAAGAELAAARHRATRRSETVDVGGKRIALVSAEEASQSLFDANGAAGRATQASGQVAEQRAKIAALKVALEEAELRAPYDGVVTGLYFEAGMNVHANETVVRIVGGGEGLRVRIAVSEDERARAGAMKHARLVLDDGRVFTATIQRVSPEVEPASRTYLVEGDVELPKAEQDSRNHAQLAGRTARATFTD
jgi:RND family efflux transporter MFP subunit